jgi:hypothetical protein
MSLYTIPVDTTQFKFNSAGPVSAQNAYNPDRNAPRIQETNDDGVPLWTIQVSTMDGNSLAVFRVRFASATEPKIEVGAALNIHGLSIRATVNKFGQAVQYFSAASVNAVAPVKQG